MDTIVNFLGSIITVICLVVCCLLFIFCKSKDKTGNKIVLNNGNNEKPWAMQDWIAGIFIAGTGVALICGVPRDLNSLTNQGFNPWESIMLLSFWNCAPVWALYAVMGLWYINHMESKIGKLAAMLSTILGMAISLWTGMESISRMIGIDFPGLKFILASVTVIISIFSAKNSWLKKMSKTAVFMFGVSFLVLLATPLESFEMNKIKGSLTGKFWYEYFFGATSASWIFWFLSWTPTVSRWLAHISNGRTIREYIAGTLIIPTILGFLWIAFCWKYQNVINSFSIANNISSIFPSVVFIISGILFMSGTLDSDCKVFTEDLELVTKGALKQKKSIPYYGIFVISIFCLFISGIIRNPYGFNEYSTLIFVPLLIWSIFSCIRRYILFL